MANSRMPIMSTTTLVAGDLSAVHANWGAGATQAIGSGSTDNGCRLSFTAAGTPAANPTVTLTFHDGAFAAIPHAVVSRGEGVAPATGFWAITAISTTAITLTFFGTPVAASVYIADLVVLGL